MTDYGHILGSSVLPPQVRAQLPTNPAPRTPHESLAMLIGIITKLAERGPGTTNGLTVTQTPDDNGVTIRIDLPH